MTTVPPACLVIMGVSGCGKSTVAALLAGRLGWPFVEGDDLHPPENIEKMRRNLPLDDADREPWLRAIAATVRRWHASGSAGIITCSALRREYRAIISGGDEYPVTFVYIKGGRALIAGRLAGRLGHFMPASLLDSQFAALEEPDPAEGALILDAALPPTDLADAVVRSLESRARHEA